MHCMNWKLGKEGGGGGRDSVSDEFNINIDGTP